MLKKLINNLFLRKRAAKHKKTEVQSSTQASAPQAEPQFPLGNGFYWEFEQVRNGYGGYKTVNAYLLKVDDPCFRRCIVNGEGEIQNFPGFKERTWERQLEFPMAAQRVSFVFWISPYQDGKACVRWLIQPDGRYFEDEDGFGAEHCDEIEVYSFLNEQGEFTVPFFQNEKTLSEE